jgi:fumarate hydratase class II
MNKETTEEDHLAELFSMESVLNTLICEYCGYEPTKEIARQMLELNTSLLKAMNARKKELGVTEWWGYEDDNPNEGK